MGEGTYKESKVMGRSWGWGKKGWQVPHMVWGLFLSSSSFFQNKAELLHSYTNKSQGTRQYRKVEGCGVTKV